jgi:hypothetical protein
MPVSVPVYLPNTLCKTLITGNLVLNGNLNLNSQNVYLGYLAGTTNVADVDNMKNVAIGSSCATYQTGSNNVSIGYDAATNSTTQYSGANNVSIGYNSGFNSGSTSTSNGVAIGVNSLIDVSGSIAIGSSATARGFRNIAIGSSATTGSTYCGNSIAIGVGANTGSYGNSVAIGFGATSTANNEITIGTSSNLIAFPGMLNNYGSYKLSNPNVSIPYNTNTICIFDFPVYSCDLISYYDGSGSFMNVSNRSLVIFISYSFIANFTGSISSSFLAFITKNNNTGTPLQLQTVINANQTINANVRMTVSAIDVFAPNDTFQCWTYFSGNSGNTAKFTFNDSGQGSNICSFVVF